MATNQAPNLDSALQALRQSRPVFHSESDFKHALSWQIQKDNPQIQIRLEVGNLIEGADRRYLDIWLPDFRTGIELKYRTIPATVQIGEEEFDLKKQGATLLGRYDFWHDVTRLEGSVHNGRAREGFAIFLTNDHLYWNPGRPNNFDQQFQMHEGREVSETLAWAPGTGSGTTKDRESPLSLRDAYMMRWREYSNLQGTGNTRFRYLLLHVRQ